MAAKKVKRKPKKLFIFMILGIILLIVGVASYFIFFDKETVKEAKVLSKIDDYGYVLKSNKSSAYKKLFKELENTLSEKSVDEEKYAKTITKMFIVDFYSLGDRTAKTDIGGVDFVHEKALDNFVLNAENTLYKYVESNIYGDREQELPIVDTVTIDNIEKEEYSYLETIDENAYKVTASWTYTDSKVANGYQDSGTFIFVHNDKKLVLVEISSQE